MRISVALLALACVLIAASPPNAIAKTGIPVPEMAACDTRIKNFVRNKGIPGLSFALARDGRIVYSRSFGVADLAATEVTRPYHMFRIGSVSKSITSIALYRLIEAGALSLSDKVFGVGGLLEEHPDFSAANIVDKRIYDVTVKMLLEHTAGWDARVNCTPNPTSPYPSHLWGCYPSSFPLHVTETLGRANPVTNEAMTTFLLESGLNFKPGKKWSYSNVGFMVVGEIIETLSGMPYEEYVRTELLHPLGIYDMHIGKTLYEDKREREVEYRGYFVPGLGTGTLSSYGDGTFLPWEYGGWHIESISAAGAWIATAQDLLKLLTAVDGFATKPDILSASSHASMTKASNVYRLYAKGWVVNSKKEHGHGGSYPGTSALWWSTSDGYTWAVLMNIRKDADRFWTAAQNLGPACIASTSTWPTHDLMASPTIAAFELAVAEWGGDLEITWKKGNGERRIVVVSAESTPKAFPLDGRNYEAASLFGDGSDLGGENYVVYDGTGERVIVRGLTVGETYRFRVYEYKQNADTGEHALYLLGDHPEIIAERPEPPDAYQCYDLKGSKGSKGPKGPKGSAKFKTRELFLSDQFGETVQRATKGKELCAPVEVDGVEVSAPEAQLLCYDLKRRHDHPHGPAPEPIDVWVSNEFGDDQHLSVKHPERPERLCVPSTWEPPYSDTARIDPWELGLDHFLCYGARDAAKEFDPIEMSLVDQFQASERLLEKAKLFCNPVDKDGEGIIDPATHLSCYELKALEGKAKLQDLKLDALVSNDFDAEQRFRLRKPKTVCLPSFMVLD